MLKLLVRIWTFILKLFGRSDEKKAIPTQPFFKKADLITAFDNVSKATKPTRYKSNNAGGYAWGESYIMDGCITMYHATGDIKYLKTLIAHADHVLSKRDDRVGLVDYLGQTRPTWSDAHYTKRVNKDQLQSYPAHTGMITFPMIAFAELVSKNKSLHSEFSDSGENFTQVASRYIKDTTECMDCHDGEWDDEVGAYRMPYTHATYYPGAILPHNMNAAMGRSLITLYNLTGKKVYLEKVISLADHFKSYLIYKPTNNSYIWDYWDGSDTIFLEEDVSHGAIEVRFAQMCYDNNIIFSKEDIIRFGNTITKEVYVSPSKFNDRVYYNPKTGRKPVINRYAEQLPRWLSLSKYNREVYKVIAEYYAPEIIKYQEPLAKAAANTTLIAIANLTLYDNK